MVVGDKKMSVVGAMLAGAVMLGAGHAAARGFHHGGAIWHHHHLIRYARVAGPRVIQCVAFAKQDAGIEISGNARDWWDNAAGIYDRGSRPEGGSVLSFRANGRMPLGHVAVVSGVQDSRTILIDQSHWNSRGITRDIQVKDVSEENDWSAVRVELGHGNGFGSIYPTHGFIYPRPDGGSLQANVTYAPLPVLDPAPGDLRGTHVRRHRADTEIAEAPARPLDLTLDGPNRTFQ